MDWKLFTETLLKKIGFEDFRVEIDQEHRHGNIFVYDAGFSKEFIPPVVESINHLAQLIAQKGSEEGFFFDVNNYRKEREGLIIELAKAAARKVMATKQGIALPAMNSYERRLVHVELAANPEVKTESDGMGRDRHVMIRPI